jgi:hypothetical protein
VFSTCKANQLSHAKSIDYSLLSDFTGFATAALIEEMQIYFLQSLEMVKPKQAERKRKMIRTNDRHITEMNYKRGF